MKYYMHEDPENVNNTTTLTSATYRKNSLQRTYLKTHI
jgi:hypothetical protein